MNILLLCKRYYTNKDLIIDRYGRLFHFPNEWKKQGHHVTVIALNYHNSDNTNEHISGVDFISVPVSPRNMLRGFRTIKQVVGGNIFDVIIASGDPIVGFVGLLLSSLQKKPFVFDVYDDYAAFGIGRIPGMKLLFKLLIKKARIVVCVSNALKNQFAHLNPNITLAPNGTDISMFYPQSKNEARKILGLNEDGTYIGYAGSMDQRFDYHTLMDAFIRIKTTIPDAVLLMAGQNKDSFDLNDASIRYLGSINQDQVPTIITASDVMVLPYSNHHLAKTCNPCKLTEFLACDRPVVAANISDISDYLPDTLQSLYECGSASDLAEKVVLQIKSPELRGLQEDHLWENIAKKLIKDMQSLVK